MGADGGIEYLQVKDTNEFWKLLRHWKEFINIYLERDAHDNYTNKVKLPDNCLITTYGTDHHYDWYVGCEKINKHFFNTYGLGLVEDLTLLAYETLQEENWDITFTDIVLDIITSWPERAYELHLKSSWRLCCWLFASDRYSIWEGPYHKYLSKETNCFTEVEKLLSEVSKDEILSMKVFDWLNCVKKQMIGSVISEETWT
jgi:hypothetical protein